MIYSIEYFRDTRKLAAVPWKASDLDTCITHARNQMMIHKADFARIIDVDRSGAEVWSERREPGV
jgi:hypothetical protein